MDDGLAIVLTLAALALPLLLAWFLVAHAARREVRTQEGPRRR
jgi:hypothetical protein